MRRSCGKPVFRQSCTFGLGLGMLSSILLPVQNWASYVWRQEWRGGRGLLKRNFKPLNNGSITPLYNELSPITNRLSEKRLVAKSAQCSRSILEPQSHDQQ